MEADDREKSLCCRVRRYTALSCPPASVLSFIWENYSISVGSQSQPITQCTCPKVSVVRDTQIPRLTFCSQSAGYISGLNFRAIKEHLRIISYQKTIALSGKHILKNPIVFDPLASIGNLNRLNMYKPSQFYRARQNNLPIFIALQ